jgi:hypothetical protein
MDFECRVTFLSQLLVENHCPAINLQILAVAQPSMAARPVWDPPVYVLAA